MKGLAGGANVYHASSFRAMTHGHDERGGGRRGDPPHLCICLNANKDGEKIVDCGRGSEEEAIEYQYVNRLQ